MVDKKVMITGAAGSVGFHLAKHVLSSTNYEVVLVDNFSRSEWDSHFSKLLEDGRVSFLEGDLNVLELPDVDTVYHLASINGTGRFYSTPWDVCKSAGQGSMTILERYKTSGAKILVASTSEVYAGATEAGIQQTYPTDENTPLVIPDIKNPRWSYASGKIFTEALAIAAAQQFGADVKILRLNNIFGPRMGYEHFIPQFLKRLMNGDGTVYGADQTRSFLFVKDAVELILKLGDSDPEAGSWIYHVGSEDERKIYDVALSIASIVNSEIVLSKAPAPIGSTQRRQPSLAKIQGEFPEWRLSDFDAGLRETVDWYLSDLKDAQNQ